MKRIFTLKKKKQQQQKQVKTVNRKHINTLIWNDMKWDLVYRLSPHTFLFLLFHFALLCFFLEFYAIFPKVYFFVFALLCVNTYKHWGILSYILLNMMYKKSTAFYLDFKWKNFFFLRNKMNVCFHLWMRESQI